MKKSELSGLQREPYPICESLKRTTICFSPESFNSHTRVKIVYSSDDGCNLGESVGNESFRKLITGDVLAAKRSERWPQRQNRSAMRTWGLMLKEAQNSNISVRSLGYNGPFFPTQRKRLQFINTQRQQHDGSNNGRRNNLELLVPSLPARIFYTLGDQSRDIWSSK